MIDPSEVTYTNLIQIIQGEERTEPKDIKKMTQSEREHAGNHLAYTPLKTIRGVEVVEIA